ncbi:MAG: hypothetical protein QOE08_1869 [Thermoleophilaceae bacterium]|nr:hypothetical protein [Thermoleophilaceae bacterium]
MPPLSDDDLRIAPATADELDELLPLIAGYQRFYGATSPDDARNREFFGQFIDPSELGSMLGAWQGDKPVGYAGLHWTFTSISATEVVLLNDLFVIEDARGAGVGRRLIEATVAIARERGAPKVRWWTELDNRRAQALYESTGADRSAWFEYELDSGAG